MFKITLIIEGMACGMCEAHVNDAIRSAFKVKKLASSHKRGETVFLAETSPAEEALLAVIEKTGYHLLSVTAEPYEKKKLFGILG